MSICTFRSRASRFTFLSVCGLAAACCAAPTAPRPAAKPAAKTTATKPAATKAAMIALPIALPKESKVEFEVDGTNQDVLGMLKAFTSGLEEANAASPAAAPEAPASRSPWLQLLGDKQFSAILKDVSHLHLVVYHLPDADDATTSMSGSMSGSMSAPAKPATSALTMENFDALTFYDKPMLAAGGRLSLQADMKSTKIRMFAFDAPHGFGLVAQGPSRIIVARSEGYPDMAALGRMINLGSAK